MDLKPVSSDDHNLTIHEPLCAVFRGYLKSLDLKYTPERAQILDTLIVNNETFEAEGLQEALAEQGHKVSKATVYRTIKLLQEAGIIHRVALDADQAHYRLAYTSTGENLLVRIDTNDTQEIDAPGISEIVKQLCESRGLEVTGHRLLIYATSKGNADA